MLRNSQQTSAPRSPSRRRRRHHVRVRTSARAAALPASILLAVAISLALAAGAAAAGPVPSALGTVTTTVSQPLSAVTQAAQPPQSSAGPAPQMSDGSGGAAEGPAPTVQPAERPANQEDSAPPREPAPPHETDATEQAKPVDPVESSPHSMGEPRSAQRQSEPLSGHAESRAPSAAHRWRAGSVATLEPSSSQTLDGATRPWRDGSRGAAGRRALLAPAGSLTVHAGERLPLEALGLDKASPAVSGLGNIVAGLVSVVREPAMALLAPLTSWVSPLALPLIREIPRDPVAPLTQAGGVPRMFMPPAAGPAPSAPSAPPSASVPPSASAPRTARASADPDLLAASIQIPASGHDVGAPAPLDAPSRARASGPEHRRSSETTFFPNDVPSHRSGPSPPPIPSESSPPSALPVGLASTPGAGTGGATSPIVIVLVGLLLCVDRRPGRRLRLPGTRGRPAPLLLVPARPG